MNVAARRVVMATAVVGALVVAWVAASRPTARDEAPTASVQPTTAVSTSLPRRERSAEPAPASVVATDTEVIVIPDPQPKIPRSAATTQQRDNPITLGLRWFKARQSKDGSWHDPATTGIALLTFLGSGVTHQSGSFRETVKNGLKSLREFQDADGCLVSRDSPRMLRDHAVAGLALTEAYGMSGSRFLKEPAQRAVDFALRSRMSSGWGANGRIDVETTGWMSMLLKSAVMSELDVERSAMEDAVAAIDAVTDRATGRVTAPGGGLSDEAVTAVGMLVRVHAGRDPKDDEMLLKGADVLAAKPPERAGCGPTDQAAWYFGTLAMFQIGGDRWARWKDAMSGVLERPQSFEDRGDNYGSWDPPGASASDADRVWSTAFVLLGAHTYYWFPVGSRKSR